MSKENPARQHLAEKRTELQQQEAIRREATRVEQEEELQEQKADALALRPSLGFIIAMVLAIVGLVAMASYLWYPVVRGHEHRFVVGEVLRDRSALWFLLVLFSVSLLSGSVQLILALASAVAVRRWASADALLLSSEAVVTGYMRSGLIRQAQGAYEYEVDGRLYGRSFLLSRWSSSFGPDDASIRAKHPPGTLLAIRYNPQRPQCSFVPGYDREASVPTVSLLLELLLIAAVSLTIAALVAH